MKTLFTTRRVGQVVVTVAQHQVVPDGGGGSGGS